VEKVNNNAAKQIRACQVDQLYTRMPTVAWLTFIIITLLVLILWPILNHTLLLVWWGATAFIYALRWILVTRYKKTKPTPNEIERWATGFLIGSIFGGLAWGAAGLFLFSEKNLTHQIVLILIVAGMASMGVTTLSSVRENIVSFLFCVLLPPFFRFVFIGGRIYLTIAALILFYLAGLLLTTRFITDTYVEMITLRIKSMQQTAELQASDKKTKIALQEKEVLLKEIHHRVKNNLQTIVSLLNLQAGYINDKEAVEVFENSKDRVRAMALIHEKLYESKDLARVDFGDYIRNLVKPLYESYAVGPGQVQLKMEVENTSLDIDTSIPLGLIINELVSNSLKHAFPGSQKGELYVLLGENKHEGKDNEYDYTLIVKDNGIGFPADIDSRESESLGMLLIKTLVKQLHGVINVDTKKGTAFTIKFQKRKYQKRI
jgi:two-component sensor histidine kinase